MVHIQVPVPVDRLLFKAFKVLMATTVSSQIWCSANSKAECQSSAANDDHQHHDEGPEDIELDLGSAYWNEALQQLRWSCVNCDRSVVDYECGLQKLQRGAKLDQSIKEAAVAVSNFGSMDMKLYKAWPDKGEAGGDATTAAMPA
eukprot:s4036_g13.t1